MPTIAYIAPELTALSETFVYEELAAVERAGFTVLPFCVRRPGRPALEAQSIADRTIVLYDRHPVALVFAGAVAALGFGPRAITLLSQVLADVVRAGPHRLGSWKLVYQWLTAARMGQSIQARSCTHIHAHFVSVPTQIAMYASAFTGIPYTATAHANDIFQNGLLLREKAARAKKLLTISHYNKRFLVKIGIPDAQVDVVRCTPDFGHLPQAELPSERPPFKLGTLCRLVEKKGVDDLVEAVALLTAEGLDVHLDIAGDGPERPSLEVLVRERGLGACVAFLGAMDHRSVAAWMQSLHVFVLACKEDRNGDIDGIPVALMEAMSLGVPVLSTRISGIPELVIDGQTGLLAEPGQAASLAGKIRESLAAGNQRQQLADAGRVHVAAEFGRQVNVRRLIRTFGVADNQES